MGTYRINKLYEAKVKVSKIIHRKIFVSRKGAENKLSLSGFG